MAMGDRLLHDAVVVGRWMLSDDIGPTLLTFGPQLFCGVGFCLA